MVVLVLLGVLSVVSGRAFFAENFEELVAATRIDLDQVSRQQLPGYLSRVQECVGTVELTRKLSFSDDSDSDEEDRTAFLDPVTRQLTYFGSTRAGHKLCDDDDDDSSSSSSSDNIALLNGKRVKVVHAKRNVQSHKHHKHHKHTSSSSSVSSSAAEQFDAAAVNAEIAAALRAEPTRNYVIRDAANAPAPNKGVCDNRKRSERCTFQDCKSTRDVVLIRSVNENGIVGDGDLEYRLKTNSLNATAKFEGVTAGASLDDFDTDASVYVNLEHGDAQFVITYSGEVDDLDDLDGDVTPKSIEGFFKTFTARNGLKDDATLYTTTNVEKSYSTRSFLRLHNGPNNLGDIGFRVVLEYSDIGLAMFNSNPTAAHLRLQVDDIEIQNAKTFVGELAAYLRRINACAHVSFDERLRI